MRIMHMTSPEAKIGKGPTTPPKACPKPRRRTGRN